MVFLLPGKPSVPFLGATGWLVLGVFQLMEMTLATGFPGIF